MGGPGPTSRAVAAALRVSLNRWRRTPAFLLACAAFSGASGAGAASLTVCVSDDAAHTVDRGTRSGFRAIPAFPAIGVAVRRANKLVRTQELKGMLILPHHVHMASPPRRTARLARFLRRSQVTMDDPRRDQQYKPNKNGRAPKLLPNGQSYRWWRVADEFNGVPAF